MAASSLPTIAVTGASGLIGRKIVEQQSQAGRRVLRLVRHAPRTGDELQWSPNEGVLESAGLAGVELVFHLAGESLSAWRWTAAKKRAIYASRVEGTRVLCEALARMDTPPRALIAASAVGYYGHRGDTALTEQDGPGEGFLSEVCQAWEAAAEPARAAGIRVVHARLGIVLDAAGGALAAMLPSFRVGLGAELGAGDQWVSWVTISDATAALAACARDDALQGPVNVVSPHPVTNRELTRAIGAALNRRPRLRVPAFALALGGEMAREMLLASTRALPQVLMRQGFRFAHTNIDDGLRAVLVS